MQKPTILEHGRTCSECYVFKVWEEFYTDPTGVKGRQSKCKECRRARRRQVWKEDIGGHKAKAVARKASMTPDELVARRFYEFEYRLRTVFKITVADFDFMMEEQNYVCFLCEEQETKIHHQSGSVMRLTVDHDHRCCKGKKSCGKCIRGLLCYECNLFLGKIEMKPRLVEKFNLGSYVNRRPLEE